VHPCTRSQTHIHCLESRPLDATNQPQDSRGDLARLGLVLVLGGALAGSRALWPVPAWAPMAHQVVPVAASGRRCQGRSTGQVSCLEVFIYQ